LQKSFCDGAGNCAAQTPMTCAGNLSCMGNACFTMCSQMSDCASGYACVSGACKPICVVDDPNSKVDDVCVVGP
jgi:hypothetical protein